MLNPIITTYLLSQLNCTAIEFGRMDWVWNDGAGASIDMQVEKVNNIDGILILNFGISTTGVAGNVTITDVKASKIIYTANNGISTNILSPFFYFSLGYDLKFISNVNCVYGFNYITVRKK